MTQARQPANGITEGVVWKQLLTFFFPILLGTFCQQLYNTADAMIVGQSLGKEALAAVGGATGTISGLVVGFFVGVASGATVILAQFYGAKKAQDASRTTHTAIALSLLCGVAMSVVGIPLGPVLLRAMDTPADVLPGATTYLQIYFLGMVPSLIYNIGAGILRAVGDSKRPLYFLIAACGVNILLDLLFVVRFRMGVAGAAWATILSQTVSAMLVLMTLRRSEDCYQLHWRQIRFHRGLMVPIIRLGLPAGLQSVMYSLSNIIIQKAINAFGTTTMAAWTAYGKLDQVYWMTISAFGIAITTFVGQNYGAGRFDRVRQAVRECLLMALGATLVLCAVLLVSGNLLYHLFSKDEEVIALGMDILRFLVPCYVLYLCVELLSGAVRGTGDVLMPTLITLFGVCLLRVIWLLAVVPQHNTLMTVLASYPITWALTSGLFILYYLRGTWLRGHYGEPRK